MTVRRAGMAAGSMPVFGNRIPDSRLRGNDGEGVGNDGKEGGDGGQGRAANPGRQLVRPEIRSRGGFPVGKFAYRG